MNVFLHEFRQALRGSIAQPGFSLLVVGVLAMGLACVMFVLIIIGSMVMRPLPFPEAGNLQHIGLDNGHSRIGRLDPMRADDLLQLRRRLDGLAEVSGFQNASINLSDLDRPQRFDGAFVAGNLFKVLGVAPMLGRDFGIADETPGAASVVMLSESLWKSRYGADPGVIGRQIRVNAKTATVIGVMPADFSYPRRQTVWIPAQLEAGVDDINLTLVSRRTPQATDAAISTTLQAWLGDARQAEPEHFSRSRIAIEPLAFLTVHAGTRAVQKIMLVSTLLVLLVACANAANLLLTRTLGRRHELAIRVALGADRKRLTLHLLAQSLLLTLLAAAIALLLAKFAAQWLDQAFRSVDDGPPLWIHFALDWRIVLITIAVALLTGLAAGLLPALRVGGKAMSGDLRDSARNTGGGMARLSRALMVGEIALSLTLLIAVGTFIRGVTTLNQSDLGIDPKGILTARIGLFESAYPTGADQVQLFQRIIDRLRDDPAVIDAAAATSVPGIDGSRREILADGEVAGRDAALPSINFAAVDDHFFSTYGIGLIEGRGFDTRDTANGTPVAIVDQGFAARYASDGNVIGRRFRLDPTDPEGPTVTVVGVVAPLWMDRPGEPIRPALLTPLRQHPERIVSLAIRVKGDPLEFALALAEHVREVDADTPAYWVRSYEQVMRQATFDQRLLAQIFAAFGIVALVLAGAGVYGVIAFNVGQRTREIGVRRALGASSQNVFSQILGRSGWLVGGGLGIGLALGLALARMLNSSMQGIPGAGAAAADLFSASVAVAVLLIAAAIAVVVPVRRALRVDPLVALRHE